MNAKTGAGVRRPPSLAVSGHATAAAGPTSRPIRLATGTATPARTKRATAAGGSLPGSAKKAPSSGSMRNSPMPKKPAATASAKAPSARTADGAAATVRGASTASSPPPPPPPPPMTGFSPVPANPPHAKDGGGGGTSLSSASPTPSYAPTTATTAHRSLQAPSAAGAASVAATTSAVTGERYEPTEYKVGFSLEGNYTCVAAVPQTAALWMGNRVSGGLDVYSSTTGGLTVSLPPRRQRERERLQSGAGGSANRDRVQEVLFPSTSPVASPAHHSIGGGAASTRQGRASVAAAAEEVVVRPTALCASRTHMWVGYNNGNVAVYDHLVLSFVTEGNFHHNTVVKFALLDDGTVVSASEDGALVHWDTEDKNFEAIARLPVLWEGSMQVKSGAASSSGHGELSALVALPRSSVVLCGFHSGTIYAVDVRVAAEHLSVGTAASYRPSLVPLHDGRVNALAVLGDVLFSASEDGSVCCTQLHFSTAATGSSSSGGGTASVSNVTYGVAAPSSGTASTEQRNASWRLLKRVVTAPSVRGLLADRHTLSLYVAYADGLMERWSGNVNDDFGVEEVIREGMRIASDDAVGEEEEEDVDGSRSGKRKVSTAKGKKRAAAPATLLVAGSGGSGSREVTGLVAINAVETLQVLALSSNGVNKVWYGHRNLLEENISTSINALNAVICEDAHDAAVWRERVNLLKMKENERKAKYVLILEQLSELRLLLTFYGKWRRRVVSRSVGKTKEAIVKDLASRSEYRLLGSYFGKWASFYDTQQKQIRRYTLSRALAEATKAAYLVSVLHRWQMHLVQRRVLSSSQNCADVLARASAALLAAPCFHKWVRFARTKVERRESTAALQQSEGLSESRLTRLALKAQRQTLHRALAHWLDTSAEKQRRRQRQETWDQYMGVYARLQDAKRAKRIFQGWRRWADKRTTYTALAAVAELRGRQCQIQAQQTAFLRWCQLVRCKRLEAQAAVMTEVEKKLKAAEAEAGSDIFEKLQLQKHIDQLIQQQESEDRLLQQDQARLRALQDSRDTTLRQREQEQQERARGRQEDGSVLLLVSEQTASALPVTSPQGTATAATTTTATPTAAVGKGLMASHANYFRHLIDQQRLSPAVLAHMPLSEAIYHVMSQLKGNVLNMYTDMGLFRQVKDKRRAGTSAVAIFLENFGEVKRSIVASLRRGTLKAGGRAARWPLSLEALDSIPAHHCASVLSAIKTMVVTYDLISPEDADTIVATCEEVVANADWLFLIARSCHMRRKPQLPINNRV